MNKLFKRMLTLLLAAAIAAGALSSVNTYAAETGTTETDSEKESTEVEETQPEDISGAVIKLSYSSVTYDGTAKEPDLTVKLNGEKLIRDTDYTVKFSNNTNAGTASVKITGIDNYTGTASASFTIKQADISSAVISVSTQTYTGSALKPSIKVTYNGTTLKKNTDYTVSYSNNTSVGTAKVTIKGTGNFTGTAKETFKIKAGSISGASVTLSKTTYTYNGNTKKPSVSVVLNGKTLKKGTDYTVSYSNNKNAGTASVTITGTGNYTGTIKKTFTINKKSVSNATVTLSKTSYTYNGSAKKPTPTVVMTWSDGTTTTLKKGTDYTVTYKSNTSAGTATVIITGKGNYKGTVKKTFKIKAKSISSGSVSLSKTSYTYNGESKKPSATVKVTLSGTKKTLKKGTNYTISYKNNKSIGTATVTIKGTGNYTGTLTKTFKIKPKKVTISSVKSTTAKKITVKWTKLSGSVKYQICYRVEGSSKWSKTAVGTSTVSKTLSSLKAGKTYEIKIRAYKKVSGKTYYGEWSSTKTIQCKADKIIYLTFDDGPSENMGEILDILAEYDVKATFFVTGSGSSCRSLITRAYNEGHTIGLHSYSHDYSKIYSSSSAFYKDLKKISDLVKKLTGEKSYILRFPGGSSNTVSRKYCTGIMTTLTKSVESKGYTYFDWNLDSGDASGNNVAVSTIVKNSTSSSANVINLLMHCTDAKDTTVTALPQIIEYYQKKGYVFEAITADSYTAHHGVNN